MSIFKRSSGFFGDSINDFIDEFAPKCPLCNSLEPSWTHKLKKHAFDVNQMYYKCSICNGILAFPASDVMGMGNIPITTSGYVKNQSWHYASVMNIEIIDTGSSNINNLKTNEPYSVEEIQAIISDDCN